MPTVTGTRAALAGSGPRDAKRSSRSSTSRRTTIQTKTMQISRALPIAAALGLVLAGCGQASLPEAADGTDLNACADADCTVRVGNGAEIPLDDEFGMTPVQITISGDEITCKSTDGGGSSFSVSGSAKVRSRLQSISIEALGIKGDEAVVKITP